jgi:tRNA pseudouridine32 synthase/23S rRNA pseudouridine746 synthase
LTFSEHPSAAPEQDFTLIYADAALLVANKPDNLLSVPGRGEEKQDCLIRRVQTRYPDALIVHRLDFNTSGLLVLARGKDMHRRLSILFQERQVDKRYVAVVDGQFAEAAGQVDLPLLVDWPNRPLHAVNFTDGKPSQTLYQVLAYDAEKNCSRVALTPLTGRTHQLRVHMKAIGHTILGDPLYADSATRAKASRLLLHAEYLAFAHPLSGAALAFTCPADF